MRKNIYIYEKLVFLLENDFVLYLSITFHIKLLGNRLNTLIQPNKYVSGELAYLNYKNW